MTFRTNHDDRVAVWGFFSWPEAWEYARRQFRRSDHATYVTVRLFTSTGVPSHDAGLWRLYRDGKSEKL